MTYARYLAKLFVIVGLVVSPQAFAQDGTFAVESVSGVPQNPASDFSGVDLQDVINKGYGPQDLEMYQASLDNGTPNDYTQGCQHEESQNCYNLNKSQFAPIYGLENQCGTLYGNNYATCAAAVAQGYGFTQADVTLWAEASGPTNTAACTAEYSVPCTQITKAQYAMMLDLLANCSAYAPLSYASCKAAVTNGYGYTSYDVALWNDANNTATYDAACQLDHSAACTSISKLNFETVKSTYQNCGIPSSYTSYAACQTATKVPGGLGYGYADYALYNEAVGGSKDTVCQANYSLNCSALTFAQYSAVQVLGTQGLNAANTIATAIGGGTPISSTDIQTVLTATGSTADSDVNLTNPLHISFIENCIGGDTSLTNIQTCSSNVDATALNQHVVVEIAGGASGTVDTNTLQAAGISQAVANIAVGNNCGPNEDQSCFSTVLASGLTTAGLTTGAFETALADHFEAQVSSADTSVPQANLTTGCTGASTSFQVPNPPAICASVNWNCTSNTNGISVNYNDLGKGNIVADTTVFSGNSYTVTATLAVGGTTRTRTINGSFNTQAAIAGAQQGYKTTGEPAWWKNYNALHRARDRCANWGGSIATHADIVAANAALSSPIIPNGTRTIFAAANGDANVSTGGKTQCSESWPTQHTLKWISGAKSQKCNNVAGFGRSFTILCKDVPSC